MTISTFNTRARVELRGEFDLAEVPNFNRFCHELDGTTVTNVTLDLSGLDFLDLTAGRALSAAMARVARGRALHLVPARAAVMRTLALASPIGSVPQSLIGAGDLDQTA